MLFFQRRWSSVNHGIGFIAAPRKNGGLHNKVSEQYSSLKWFFRFYSLFKKKNAYLMKQMAHKPYLHIILLTLWLYLKLFPNFLLEKWLIIIIKSGKSKHQSTVSIPPKSTLYRKSQCVYLLSCTVQENMVVLHYQKLTLVHFRWECAVYENVSLEQRELASLEVFSNETVT